jgi:hypothetical protein
MTRPATLLLLASITLACRHRRSAEQASPPPPVGRVAAIDLSDTTVGVVHQTQARQFNLQRAGQRDSLRALIQREAARWRAANVRNYRFIGRVSCFCPDQRGWVATEVKDGQLSRAIDERGRLVPFTDWTVFTIDKWFQDLEQMADRVSSASLVFDAKWHFPAYVTTAHQMPDGWGIHEIRGFRPNPTNE